MEIYSNPDIFLFFSLFCFCYYRSVNVVTMETKGGKKKSSSSRNSFQYEIPLGYIIEDVRPNGGIEKFRSAAYSNVCSFTIPSIDNSPLFLFNLYRFLLAVYLNFLLVIFSVLQCVRKPS